MSKVWWVMVVAIAGFANTRLAHAAGEAIPLVPVDTSDAGAPSPQPTPSPIPEPTATPQPNVIIVHIDAGTPPQQPAPVEAIPLVAPPPEPDAGPKTLIVIVDAGPIEAPHVEYVDAGSLLGSVADAGSSAPTPTQAATPTPAPVDAGAAIASVADAGAVTPAPVEPENSNFVKGELSQFLGATKIAVQTTRVGVGLGVSRIDNIIYALVEPRFDLHMMGFGLGLQVPLNLEVYNTHLDPNAPPGTIKFIGTQNFGHLRTEDYTTARDYARVLQYLTYGKKEDHLYVDIGQIYAQSLGHGEIMRRYQPNIDVDVVRIGAEVDAYNDYGGVELVTNDVMSGDIFGGLAFVKPLSFVSDNALARSLSVGFTYATNRDAPDDLTIKQFPGSGLNGCDCRPVLVGAPGTDPTNPQRFELEHTSIPVSLYGVDAELKVLRTDDIDIKPYVDFSHLVNGDSGLTLGVLGRFNFLGSPVTPTQAIRVVAEARYLGDRYRPEYFDTFYEVDKYIFLDSPKANSGVPMTQYQAVLAGLGNRAGYYLEASYAVVNWVSATVALEGDSSGPAKNLVLHAELPKLFIVQAFASYYKRGFTNFTTLSQLDQNSIAYAGARIEILPILYVNAQAYQAFQLDVDNTHTYQTTRGLEGDVELGWQF